MASSLEDYEDFLRARNEELQARAQASVAAADAAIREREPQESFSNMDFTSLVKQNIHSVLQEMDDAPEMGIRDSIDVSDDVETQSAAFLSETRAQTGAPAAAQPAPGSRRASGTGSRRASDSAQQPEEPSELDVPGNVPASVRLHKAKIRALEQEVAALKSTVKEKDKKLTSCQLQNKELQNEKLKGQKEKKNLEMELAKTKRNYDALKGDLAQKENAIRDLNSNQDRGAVKEKRSLESDQRAREVRLNRALEEVEKYKQLLEEIKANDKDGKQVAKSDYHRVISDNKKLERQRQELIVAFKKQMKLIDLLRRQKLHMEAARQIAFTEEEFLKTLDIQS